MQLNVVGSRELVVAVGALHQVRRDGGGPLRQTVRDHHPQIGHLGGGGALRWLGGLGVEALGVPTGVLMGLS